MRDERWPREAWVPLLAGLFWLWNSPGHGFVGFLFSVIPGCLLLGSGVSMLLMPGDRRISQFTALGGVLGVLFALPAFFVVGFISGLMLALASLAGFVAAGSHSVRAEPSVEGVPEPEPSHALSFQVAFDEALLATVALTNPLPEAGDHARIDAELSAARELFDARGWLEKPASYHATPPALENPEIRRERTRNIAYEYLSFDSGYAPPARASPGRERWRRLRDANQPAHAWVRAAQRRADRPWLVGIHGYQMGVPRDRPARPSRAEWFRERAGPESAPAGAAPARPAHGRSAQRGRLPRRAEVLDTVHAEAQAMWDVRRHAGRGARGQGGPGGGGTTGLSLGGYNAALLAALDDDLRLCGGWASRPSDFARAVYFRHGPALQHPRCHGSSAASRSRTGRTRSRAWCRRWCSSPGFPSERRSIFAAVCRPARSRRTRRCDLWRHWGRAAHRVVPGRTHHVPAAPGRAPAHPRRRRAPRLRTKGLRPASAPAGP